MGACTFSNVIMGKYTPSEAYNKLVSDALYETGHDSYNGTISTTGGYRNLTDYAPRYGTKAFWKWENDVLENDKFGVSKWANAGVIEILPNTSIYKDMKKSRGFSGKRGIRAFYFFGWASE